MPATFRVITFGCKVNQYESRQISELLERLGLAPVAGGGGGGRDDAPADLVIINSCVVTGEAARQCRQMIRRQRRQQPACRIIVTGCYATGPEVDEVASMEEADVVIGDKLALFSRLGDLVLQWFPQSDAACSCGRKRGLIAAAPADGGLERFAGHARAFVKIQDGCNQRCTYCIIPLVRSKIWSRAPADVVSEVERLASAGHQEIVLSGIHLGRYRHEVGDREALPRLLKQLIALPQAPRLRLSSIEIGEVSDGIISLMVSHPDRMCPHLHISLQSGDDGVLEAMHRPYSSGDYVRRVAEIRRALPGVAISTDVIVGFPGESDAAFDNTCAVVETCGFSRLHVFPYSPRPHTPAAEMSGQVDAKVRQVRAARLRRLGEKLGRRYAESLVGSSVAVLVEKRCEAGEGESGVGAGAVIVSGFDEHYLRAEVEVPPVYDGPTSYREIVRATVTGVKGNCLTAQAGVGCG